MKKVTVGFSKATSPYAIFSKAIRWGQGTSFSHVYLKISWAAADAGLIYQASGNSVNFESEEHFKTHATVVKEFELDISDEHYKKIAKYVVANLNKPYSLCQILGMTYVLVAKKLGIETKNPYKNRTDAFVCCELIQGVLSEADISFPFDPEDVGPKELFDFLVSISGQSTII